MKTIIKIIVLFVAVMAVSFIHSAVADAQPEQSEPCPPQSFVRDIDDTGAPICGQVTGCPYADSIPLDSPKCAPQVDNVQTSVANEVTELPEEPLSDYGGK